MMEKDKGGEGLTFNGFEIGRRSKQNVEDLVQSILKRGSVDDLKRDLQNQGFGLSQIDDLISNIGRRSVKGSISEERRQALERLQDVRFSIIGTPERKREPGDTLRGESGKGRLIPRDKFIPED